MMKVYLDEIHEGIDRSIEARRLKPGDEVMMNDKYYVSEENREKIWIVRSEPWLCGGTSVVLLKGKSGGYAVDGLDLITEDE